MLERTAYKFNYIISLSIILLLPISSKIYCENTYTIPNKDKLPSKGPADLNLTFISPIYNSPQPYRLYLPSSYDGTKPFPLLVALHGTGGDHNKYFDHPDYASGIYKQEADKKGIIILCPNGNDSLNRPTEWRGTGEIHVLTAVEEVCKHFLIDLNRIILTGQSMGGTGTTYLCCRYPDIFAGGIPLASTYGHLSLIINLEHIPMFYVHGEKDWPIYAQTGPIPIVEEMKRLRYNGSLWMIPNVGHNTMHISTERVIDWALQQKRVAHPKHIIHRAYFPPHGRAWWIEIVGIEQPGWYAEVDAQVENNNSIKAICKNVSELIIRPDPEITSLTKPLSIEVNNQLIYTGNCHPNQQIRVQYKNGVWNAFIESQIIPDRVEQLKRFVIAKIGNYAPTWEPTPETTLGNWLADAMREISGADIAICTKGHYLYGEYLRGVQPQPNQILYLVDLIDWLRPLDGALCTFSLTGKELLEIIELNICDNPQEERFLVQVSGCRYTFDRSLPPGSRVVNTDIQPNHTYKIVCNILDITRTDTLHLGKFFGKLNYQLLEPNTLSTAWFYALKNDGIISAKLENRVQEIKHPTTQ